MMDCSAILLAGGRSRRFGSDKTRLVLDGRPLLATLAEACAALFDEVVVVGARPGQFDLPGVRALHDLIPDSGPLGGLHAGLSGCAHPRAFVMACDMPRFHAGLAARLAETALAEDADAAVPRSTQGPQPLFAVYHKRILPELERRLARRELALRGLLDAIDVRWLEPGEWGVPSAQRGGLFLNLNRPEDLKKLERE